MRRGDLRRWPITGAWLVVIGCGKSGAPTEPAGDAAVDEPTNGFPDSVLADPAPWKSGTRLRARVMDGGYGAKLFVDWQDTHLGIACSFALAGDGRIRCLPVDEDTSILTTFFSDDACTTLVAIGPPPDDLYVRIADATCGPSDDEAEPH